MHKLFSIFIIIFLHFTELARAEEPFDFTLEKTHPLALPYLVVYEKNGKTLGYIASMHNNFSDSNNPTAKVIEKGFKEINPDLVIIEGIDKGNIESLDYLSKQSKVCFEQKKAKCGENGFGAYLANKRKVKFIAIEASELEIFRQLKAQGYRIEDGVGYMFLLYYSTAGFGLEIGPDPEKVFNQTMLGNYDDLMGSPYRYQDFVQWFKSIGGDLDKLSRKTPYDLYNDNIYTSNYNNNPSSYLSNLSEIILSIREEVIRNNIQEVLNENKFKRILIIYGANHYLLERELLYDNFGYPKKIISH